MAADFPYSADLTLFYLGKAPADGKFLKEKFLFTATTEGVSPKQFNIYADLSTGPGTPVLQSRSATSARSWPAGPSRIAG